MIKSQFFHRQLTPLPSTTAVSRRVIVSVFMEDRALSNELQKKAAIFEALQYRWSVRTVYGRTNNSTLFTSNVDGHITAVKEIKVCDMRDAECVMKEVELLRSAQVRSSSQV